MPSEDAAVVRRSMSERRKKDVDLDGIAGRVRNRATTDDEGRGGGEGDENDSGDDGDEDEITEEPEDMHEQHVDLTAISHPYHLYPTTIFPRSRAVENAIQPLLYTAMSHPAFPTISCCAPSTCCDDQQEFRRRKDELELISGDIEMGTGDRSTSGALNNEIHRLQNAKNQDHRDAETHKTKSDGSAHMNPILGRQHNARRQDGVYINQLPIFADILMSAEDVDSLPISKMVESNIGLARVTQRTLRELQGSLDDERMRRLWCTMLSSKKDLPIDRMAGKKSKGEAGDTVSPRSLFNTEQQSPYVPRTPISSIAELLSQLSVGPVLRIIDDPVTDLPTQPVVPDTSFAYGGVLGSWADDTSSAERLGECEVILEWFACMVDVVEFHIMLINKMNVCRQIK